MNNEDTPVFMCGSSWGIGIYTYLDENGKKQVGYGYSSPENPHDFTPDPYSCTETELEAHKQACKEWDLTHAKNCGTLWQRFKSWFF